MATKETANSSEVTLSTKQKVDILKNKLNAESVMEQLRNALKGNANTFIASLVELYSSDPKLQLCDANQVIKEALKAALLNLPINKSLGQAYVIPFNNTKKDERGNKYKVYEPTFQIGYKGLYQLAMRTNQYRIINADVVYEGEFQKINKLTGEVDLDGEKKSDTVVGYFSYIELVGGYRKALYMTVEQVAKHAKNFSKALQYNREVTVESLMNLAKLPVSVEGNSVGWLGNFHAMAIKTVLRNLLSKYGYLSVSLQEAIASDIDSDSTSKAAIELSQSPQKIDVTTVEYEEVNPENEEAKDVDPGF